MSIMLVACTRSPNNAGSGLPLGPASATGTVVATEVSLVRRGTHILRVGNRDLFFLESKIENLQEFDGKTVSVQGILEANSHQKYLPVLIVSSITALDMPDAPRQWRIPSLGIEVTTPRTWKANIKNDIVTFAVSDNDPTVLTITKKSDVGLPQGGTIDYVDGRRGVRQTDKATGLEDAYFIDGKTVMRLQFTPEQIAMSGADALEKAHQEFDDVIRSLRWLGGTTLSAGNTTGSGSTSQPCGGSAGILCPSGYYCDVFDAAANIGKCRKM